MSYERARGAALVDLNLDGMLDLVVVNRVEPVSVWRNVGSGDAEQPEPMGGWIAVRLRQPAPNVDAIGAFVEVRVGDRTTVHEVTVGGGHAGGQLGWIHIGLGDADQAEVRVHMARRRDRSVDDGRGGRVRDDRAGSGRRDPVESGGTAMTITATSRARLADVTCRTSACQRAEPLLPASIYADRLERSGPGWRPGGTTRSSIWADREHSANLAYLTGFDPRFEEAVLIVAGERRPGAPRRQRVLRHGRGRPAAAPVHPVPGPQPAQPAP